MTVSGNLIGLLEALGTLSITASELKQLIGLMKPDEEGKQVCNHGNAGLVSINLISMVLWCRVPNTLHAQTY